MLTKFYKYKTVSEFLFRNFQAAVAKSDADFRQEECMSLYNIDDSKSVDQNIYILFMTYVHLKFRGYEHSSKQEFCCN